jgi:acetyl-CoA carboxylase biotin carboxyl carrier protein
VPFTEDEVRDLLEVIERCGWDEVRLESDGLTLVVSKSGEPTVGPPAPAGTPAAAQPAAAAPAPAAAPPPRPDPREVLEMLDDSHASTAGGHASTQLKDVVTVLAPSLGLFWRSPKPGAPPFVEVGDRVEPDSTVCIVEVMKLMNNVKAGAAGTVSAVHADNGEMVEYGQPLVTIAPDR